MTTQTTSQTLLTLAAFDAVCSATITLAPVKVTEQNRAVRHLRTEQVISTVRRAVNNWLYSR